MAGGVWWLEEWEDWIDNPELGPIAFQFGTRPLLTKESPIGDAWKERLRTLKEGDVFLNRFSPTGFYSSAVNNGFIQELRERSERQVAYTTEAIGEHVAEYGVGPRKRVVYLTPADLERARGWEAAGLHRGAAHARLARWSSSRRRRREEILADQVACMGCLSQCRFSNWAQQEPDYSTGKRADPRSFCIQKTLQDIAHESDDAGGAGAQPDVQRPQRVPLRQGPVLLERLHPDREATGRAHPDGPVTKRLLCPALLLS